MRQGPCFEQGASIQKAHRDTKQTLDVVFEIVTSEPPYQPVKDMGSKFSEECHETLSYFLRLRLHMIINRVTDSR